MSRIPPPADLLRAGPLATVMLAFGLLTAAPAGAQQAPLLRLEIKPSQVDADKGTALVFVVMTVEQMKVAAGEPLLTHQNMAPNMTGPMLALDLSAEDDSGPVPVISDEKVGVRTWTSTRDVEGTLTVRYQRPIDNGHLGSLASIPHVDGQGIFGIHNMLFLTPRTTGRYRVRLDWDLSAMAPGSTGISSLGEGSVTTPPMPLSKMTYAMFMAGPIKRLPDPPSGAFTAAWTGEPTFDVHAAMQWTSKLHSFMSGFFLDPVAKPYYVFLRPHAGGNGVAASQAFVLGYSPEATAESVQSLLGHEMTHTWTAADLGKWYSEGNAVYYQTLLPWRAGLMSIEERLADINMTAARYYTNDVIAAPDSEILPRSWTDMRYNVLPYDRGAIYFAMLDGKIRRASGGKRGVDELIRAMVALDREEQPITEETWIDLLRKELLDEGPAFHASMLRGQTLVPESDDYGPQFRRVAAKIPRYDLGFGGPQITKRSVVTDLRPDSNAAKAGLMEGDKVQYHSSTNGAQRDPNMPLTMHVTRDGRTFDVTYLPRGELRDAYQWEPAAPARTQREPQRPSNEPQDFLREPAKPSTLEGAFTLTAVGELLYSHPLADSTDEEMQKVFRLVRQGDVTFGHCEVPFFDFAAFQGQGYGNGLLWGEAALGKDIKALGIDMVSLASNHGTDWGFDGLRLMSGSLDAHGIMHAGAGSGMQQARRASILTTPKGKVALISTSSTFKPNATANDSFGSIPARGGISTLRTRTIQLVTAHQFELVRQLATELASPQKPVPEPDATEIAYGEQIYRLADQTALTYEMDLYDHAALLSAVREAKNAADFVAFTIHAHESPTGMDDDAPAPPDFLIKLAHTAIDAGTDVVIGTGQHSLRGIEIYDGKVIFYGMGAFFLRGKIKALPETMFRAFPDATGHAPAPKPQERAVRSGGNPASWYDGVVAQVDYQDGNAKTVRLYPIDTGNTPEEGRRGVPHLADATNAKRILADLQSSSARFGTKISIEDSIGLIRLP